MENKKSLRVLALVLLCLIVFAITGIVYSTYTSDLKVSGSASTYGSKWKIAWSSISKNNNRTVGATGTVPEVSSDGVTVIDNYTVLFSDINQSFAFDITAKNYGDFNARLSSLTKGNLTCKCASVNGCSSESMARTVCDNMKLTILDSHGNEISDSGNNITLDKKGGHATYTFVLSYNQSSNLASELLSDGIVDVTVSPTTFSYIQVN